MKCLSFVQEELTAALFYTSILGAALLGLLQARPPMFVGQLLAGWIVLALLINYVTHRGWKEWNYRPGSAF